MKTDIVYLGDCIQGLKKIPENSIDCVITDPPYNILNVSDIKIKNVIIKRDMGWDRGCLDIPQIMGEFERILKDGGTFLIFCSDRQLGGYITYCDVSTALRYSNTLVWVDRLGHPKIRKRSFSNHTQYIAFGHKEIEERYTFNWLGEKKMWNVLNYNGCMSFEYGRRGEWMGHPTQKPTKLIRHLIKIVSDKGDIILDPFAGSGTTLVCAKQLGRRFIGFEIKYEYYSIIQKRLSQTSITDFNIE